MKDVAWEFVQMKWCDVVEWVKKNMLRWFGHMERKKSEEFVKKMYVSETGGSRRRGKPVVRWKDRVKEYMHEKVTNRGEDVTLARRDCEDRERWRLFYHGHPLWEIFLEGMRLQRL